MVSVQKVLSLLGQSCSGCNEKYRRQLIRKVKQMTNRPSPEDDPNCIILGDQNPSCKHTWEKKVTTVRVEGIKMRRTIISCRDCGHRGLYKGRAVELVPVTEEDS